jgi:hypothetical protein
MIIWTYFTFVLYNVEWHGEMVMNSEYLIFGRNLLEAYTKIWAMYSPTERKHTTILRILDNQDEIRTGVRGSQTLWGTCNICRRSNMQDLRFPRQWLWRIPSSGMWCRVILLRTDSFSSSSQRASVSSYYNVSSTPVLGTLMKEAIPSSSTSVLTSATQRKIPVEHSSR